MSTRGPSNPLGDRPRMAEALASLKEGLRETADPLYDSWKLRQVASDRPVVLDVEGEAARVGRPNPEAPVIEGAARLPSAIARASLAEPAEAVDIALDGTPPETPAASSTPEALSGDDAPSDGLPTEELLVEFDEEFENSDPETTIARKPSVQTDTVRVRVIRYHPFPRWALIVAASLVVFALSLVALRASLPGESTRVARPVLASEVPTPSPAAASTLTGFPASNATVAPVPPSSPPLAKSAAPSAVPQLEAAPAAAPPIESPPPSLAPAAAGAVPVRAAAPGGKAAAPKRRQGSQDFFRDPGF